MENNVVSWKKVSMLVFFLGFTLHWKFQMAGAILICTCTKKIRAVLPHHFFFHLRSTCFISLFMNKYNTVFFSILCHITESGKSPSGAVTVCVCVHVKIYFCYYFAGLGRYHHDFGVHSLSNQVGPNL